MSTAAAITPDRLLKMSASELEALFGGAEAGPIPHGEARGTAIVAPGTSLSPEIARFIRLFAWQGKVFDASRKTLRNRILLFGFEAVVAQIRQEASWRDGKPCTVLDYSQTSVIAHWVRDEIRLVGPGVYLGKAYWGRTPLLDFALEFVA